MISAHPGVSHNYKRNHAYNLWYTIAVPPGESLDEHIDVLHRESGALVTRKLPTLKLYKIGVKLDMTGKTAAERQGRGARARAARATRECRRPTSPTSSSRRSASCRTTCRTSSARSPRTASRSAATRRRCSTCLRSFKERKLMRRFAAVMNHRTAGFKANAMGVWAVPDDELDEIGPQMAGLRAVSHCYRRPTYDDWPYSVFTMVHGKNAHGLRSDDRRDPRRDRRRRVRLLWSIKEYKKIRLRYFTADWDDWRARAPGRSKLTHPAPADRRRARPRRHARLSRRRPPQQRGRGAARRASWSTPSSSTSSSKRASAATRRRRGRGTLAAVYDSVAALARASARRDRARRERDPRVGHGLLRAGADVRAGDRILTSRAEYASNVIAFLQIARAHRRVASRWFPTTTRASSRSTRSREMIDDRVRLVAISWIPTQGGLVNPAAEVGAVRA